MELEKIAKNKNVARAAVKNLSLDQLRKLDEVIQEALEQREQEEKERQVQQAQKQEKLQEIQAALEEAGLSVNDLVKEAKPRKRGRPPKKQQEA